MKEKVNTELDRFKSIADGLKLHLCTTTLTDIIAALYNKEAENKYEDFDKLVENIKEFLQNVKEMPNNVDIHAMLKDDLEQYERIFDECRFSMRTLSWIKNEMEQEENAPVSEN